MNANRMTGDALRGYVSAAGADPAPGLPDEKRYINLARQLNPAVAKLKAHDLARPANAAG